MTGFLTCKYELCLVFSILSKLKSVLGDFYMDDVSS
jgi:hypothetical protein